MARDRLSYEFAFKMAPMARIPEESCAAGRLEGCVGAPAAPFETRFALLRDAAYGYRRVLIACWHQWFHWSLSTRAAAVASASV
jgi:hypothetical protein